MVTVIGEHGFEAQAGPIIVSGYSGVCFERAGVKCEVRVCEVVKCEVWCDVSVRGAV